MNLKNRIIALGPIVLLLLAAIVLYFATHPENIILALASVWMLTGIWLGMELLEAEPKVRWYHVLIGGPVWLFILVYIVAGFIAALWFFPLWFMGGALITIALIIFYKWYEYWERHHR